MYRNRLTGLLEPFMYNSRHNGFSGFTAEAQ